MDEHELVALVKQMAAELGTPPTRDQFISRVRGGKNAITRVTGTYGRLLELSGFQARQSKSNFGNEVFERDIESHLEEHRPAKQVDVPPLTSLAVISDLHFPFVNKRVVDLFLEYVGDTKPELAVVNGDAWDMYSHTKFPRSHNVFTPREEEASARKGNEELWREVRRRSPASRCIQTMGNHDVRPMKRILEAYPAAEDWIAEHLKKIFTFDGVETIYDPREEVLVGNVLIFHGYRAKLGDHRDFTLYNTVNGHTHVGGVSFRRIRGQTLWELNSGLAGDPEAKGLTYTPQRITNWTPGFGAVDARGPRFIPS